MTRIHLSKADLSEVEEQYVLEALRSGWVAPAGPDLDAFEVETAARTGSAHSLALASGTSALHLGLLGLGVGPGSVVVLPSLTFAASANAVVYTGAEPVFVDSDRKDGNVNASLLIDAVDQLLAEGVNVAAVMSVDLFGRCADYKKILPSLSKRNIPLIEDAAEALGASYQGRPAGSFGAVSVLSFNGNKIMTTSGGGMLLSHQAPLIARARYLATQARQPGGHYEHTEIGFNYRLSNILAALGRAQLTRLPGMIARRREIRARYVDALAGVPGVRFLGRDDPDRDDAEDNCWLTCIELDPRLTRATPESVISTLEMHDIEARRVWKPLHLQPVFAQHRAFVDGEAERHFDRGVMLPSGSALTAAEINDVIAALYMALGTLG